MPDNSRSRWWVACSITILLGGVLTLVSIYALGEYGIALFVLVPVFVGITATVLYGYRKNISAGEGMFVSFSTLGLFALAIFLFAMEGAICIIMAAPIAIFLTWIGSLLGFAILRRWSGKLSSIILISFLSIPLVSFIEHKTVQPATHVVTTSLTINAPITDVWKNVIEFPKLGEPDELLFKAGISYPISAEIEGKGVGAIRKCNFSTGSFIEPITKWEEPYLLEFSVDECPAPMTELSFWNINSPHLHDYFVSTKGQFKLTRIDGNTTRLDGTTWYYHKISPSFYWKFWSDYIIHKIHYRVLDHIKLNAESAKK